MSIVVIFPRTEFMLFKQQKKWKVEIEDKKLERGRRNDGKNSEINSGLFITNNRLFTRKSKEQKIFLIIRLHSIAWIVLTTINHRLVNIFLRKFQLCDLLRGHLKTHTHYSITMTFPYHRYSLYSL